MQKAEPQHGQAQQQQPAARQAKAATVESPQGEHIAQLVALANSSPQAEKQAQLATMINASPAMAAQRKLADMIHSSPRQAAQRKLNESIHNSPRQIEQKKNFDTLSGTLQLRTSNGTPIRGRVTPSARQLPVIATLLARINHVSVLMRLRAGTLDRESDARLDMQGITTAGYHNLQIQIGAETVAAVLLHPNVGNAQLGEVLNAFSISQASGLTIIVDPDEEGRNEKPMGHYDDYEELKREDKNRIDLAMSQGQYPPKTPK